MKNRDQGPGIRGQGSGSFKGSRIQVPIDLPWVPAAVRERVRRLGNVVYPARFSGPEKKVLKTRPWMRPSEWVVKNRMMTTGRFAGLPWQGHLTPYLDAVMDALAHPGVQELVLLKCVQSGGSESIHNFVGWSVEYLKYPVMYIYPDINTGRENAQDRIIPMLRNSPALSRYLTDEPYDVTKYRINLTHMPMYIGWATSPSRLANKPIGILVFDETELYPEVAGKKHADPVSEGEKRTITFGDAKKIAYVSVPSIDTGFITQKFNRCPVKFDYHVRCPSCGAEQEMKFEGIVWDRMEANQDDGSHPTSERMRSEKLARYRCINCAALWDDRGRDAAVRSGRWLERETGAEFYRFLDERRPRSVAMKLPAWVSYFVSLSEAAGAWLNYLESGKDKNLLKDFLTKYAAEPWKIYEVKRDEHAVLKLRDDRPQGMVPASVPIAALIMTIDTQDNGFFYEIRAAGFGLSEPSWQVRFGFVETLSAIETILDASEYPDATGRRHRVRIAGIDTGGHRAAEIFDFCRRHRGRVVPLKGTGRKTPHKRWYPQEYYPGTNKVIPNGMMRLDVDVNYYKDKLSGKLEVDPQDPGAWVQCAECSLEWARQMTAEVLNDKGNWVPISESRPNHAWDLAAYYLAVADELGIRFWKEKKSEDRGQRAEGGGQRAEGGGQRIEGRGPAPPPAAAGGNWINARPGFVRR